MADLSEFGLRVLSELEELRVENVIAMLNTIVVPTGEIGEVTQLQRALLELVKAGLVEIGMEQFHPREDVVLESDEGLKVIDDLPAIFRFDSDEKLWDLRVGDMRKDRYPIILATSEGVDEGFKILSERGYQWWRTDPV